MADALGVDSSRGVVRFAAVSEADLATGGMTVQGEIEGAAIGAGGRESASVDGERGISMGRRSRSRRRERAEEKENQKSRPQTRDQAQGKGELMKVPPLPPVPVEKSALDRRTEKVQKVGRRKSFLAIFGR